MSNDTTAQASVPEFMTAEQAGEAIESMLSGDGEQQELEAQQDESEEVEATDDESEQDFEEETSAEDDAADDDETDSDESDDDAEDEQEVEAQKFTVKVDGNEVEVTLDELQKGYSRTADYTRKTQELAQVRKETQAELQNVRQERQQYAQLLGALQQQLQQATEPQADMEKLYDTDPIEWMRQKEVHRERQEKMQAIQVEQQRLQQIKAQEQQQVLRGQLETQRDLLIEKIPELRDPKQAQAAKASWIEAGKSVGLTEQELNNIGDHRVFLALHRLAEYNQMVGKRQQIKPVQKSPKAVKPGQAQKGKVQSSVVKQSQQRLQRSGNVKDAASLIEKFL